MPKASQKHRNKQAGFRPKQRDEHETRHTHKPNAWSELYEPGGPEALEQPLACGSTPKRNSQLPQRQRHQCASVRRSYRFRPLSVEKLRQTRNSAHRPACRPRAQCGSAHLGQMRATTSQKMTPPRRVAARRSQTCPACVSSDDEVVLRRSDEGAEWVANENEGCAAAAPVHAALATAQ